ncbi:zf-CCHC_4 domain-containing protein, partial [Cephalotus follicularis]
LGRVWLTFKYEKLPNFFYACGYLGHVEKGCERVREKRLREDVVEQQFGQWLKAEDMSRPVNSWGKLIASLDGGEGHSLVKHSQDIEGADSSGKNSLVGCDSSSRATMDGLGWCNQKRGNAWRTCTGNLRLLDNLQLGG